MEGLDIPPLSTFHEQASFRSSLPFPSDLLSPQAALSKSHYSTLSRYAVTSTFDSFLSHSVQVTIMFADIVGFTSLCQQVPPATVIKLLNELYSKLDALAGIYKVYKVIWASTQLLI